MPVSRRAFLASSTLLLPALGGCGLFGGSESDAPPQVYGNPKDLERPDLKVAALPTLDMAPFYIAIKDGDFEREGLNVTPISIPQGGRGVEMLIGGSVDLAFGSYTPFILAQSKGVANGTDRDGRSQGGLKLVADATSLAPRNSQVMVAADSKIRESADLEGKTVAVAGLATMAWLLTVASLEANDVDLGSISFIEMPFPDTGGAVANGVVDAAFLTEPFLTQARTTSGLRAVYDTNDGATSDMPLTGYGALGKLVEDSPKSLAGFQRAMQRATARARDSRERVEKILPEYTKVDPATAAIMAFTSFESPGLVPDQITRVPRLMVQNKMLPADLPNGEKADWEKLVADMIVKPAATTG